jgi:hypothetical protein
VKRIWLQNRDGDGGIALTEGGTLDAFIRGPNDSQGNGWSVIYSYFANPTAIQFTYQWSTTDGINYDWPILQEMSLEPFVLAMPDWYGFRYSLANSNSISSSRSFVTTGNSWVVIGVFSSDSCCGDGRISVQGLPMY